MLTGDHPGPGFSRSLCPSPKGSFPSSPPALFVFCTKSRRAERYWQKTLLQMEEMESQIREEIRKGKSLVLGSVQEPRLPRREVSEQQS